MPDVIALLESDHRKVESMFERFESSPDRALAMQICDELDVHTKVEEEIVYPVLEKVDEELEEHAEEEHDEAKGIIAKIRSASDDQLPELVKKLKDSVLHHVEEEEQKAFPKMRQQVGDQLEEMGRKAEARKAELESGAGDKTKAELYEEAKEAGVEGRSTMTKDELAEAVGD